MSTARSVHGPDQTTFSRILQTQGGDQVLAGTPLRRVAETLDIAESLLGKWKRQYEQQGDDAFPGNGKQRGESAELRRLRQQLAQVTMERDVLKKALAIFSQPTK
ncbi:transposase [Pseudomonas sp. 30_B]|uniref:transposase n=1 Tax=Pseudomonas sp. 30_B TaxID=2813575 RepID=UPI001A9FFAE8|nr:transposase [Pseudomonas sp. 30_B]